MSRALSPLVLFGLAAFCVAGQQADLEARKRLRASPPPGIYLPTIFENPTTP